jgi:hypothetical protein
MKKEPKQAQNAPSEKLKSKSGKELLGNSGYRVKHRCRCLCVTRLIPETFDSFKELQS